MYFYRDEIKSLLNLLIDRYKPESGWQSSVKCGYAAYSDYYNNRLFICVSFVI